MHMYLNTTQIFSVVLRVCIGNEAEMKHLEELFGKEKWSPSFVMPPTVTKTTAEKGKSLTHTCTVLAATVKIMPCCDCLGKRKRGKENTASMPAKKKKKAMKGMHMYMYTCTGQYMIL